MVSVCAVVLTYNRKELLQQCLEAIALQTRGCDKVIVVDNASSDGTDEFLDANWRGRVEVHSLAENVGAAGGFNVGIRAAYRSNPSFIWVMDDDVIADPDALEQLLLADERLNGHGVQPSYLVSVARSRSGVLTEIPDLDRRRNALGFPGWARFLDLGLVPTLGATFASILLPRSTVQEHGFPLASMFIFGEDREFTVRVTRDRPGYLVGASRVLHARKLEGALDTLTETNPVRLRYHYFMHRNTTSTILAFDRPSRVALHLWRQLLLTLKLVARGKLKKAGIVANGTIAGLFYHPRPELAEGPADALPMTAGDPRVAGI